jgi:hypothetical protein
VEEKKRVNSPTYISSEANRVIATFQSAVLHRTEMQERTTCFLWRTILSRVMDLFFTYMGLWEENIKDEEIQTNVLLHCLVRTDSSYPVLICLIVRL